MKHVTVGMFNLPGIAFDKDEMTDELRDEMIKWSDESNYGMFMTDRLWSFKNEGQRDFFILRWAERIPTEKE
jgi:hypothetical protein